jgi:hypothetical protein
MEQSPSCEADSSSASQNISQILWNSKVYYRINKSRPPVQIWIVLSENHVFERSVVCVCDIKVCEKQAAYIFISVQNLFVTLLTQ